MDTRNKIIEIEEARAISKREPAVWVTGHFDPLIIEQVRRIRGSAVAGRKLIVEVTNAENPLLPQRARAELVAALADVDFVVMQQGAALATEPEEAEITSRFIEHVLSRQGGDKG